ncbi:MAG TPA: ATP-binding protein [Oculatellaceae cyanobacterium]
MRSFLNMPLKSKLLISFSVLWLCFGCIVWVALMSLLQVQSTCRALYDNDMGTCVDLMLLSENIRRIKLAGQTMMLIDDPTSQDKQIEEIALAEREDNIIIDRLKKRFVNDAETANRITHMNTVLQQFYAVRDQGFSPQSLAKKTEEEKLLILKAQRHRFQEMQELSDQLKEMPHKLSAEHLQQARANINQTIQFFLCTGLLAIAISISLAMLLSRLVIVPIKEITNAATKIGTGDMSYELTDDARKDEVGVLRTTFVNMGKALADRSLELEKALEDVKESNAQLQHFAYIAAHDLKEPLRTIVSYLELLEKRQKTELDAKSVKYIKNAINGADRMGQLIDALLSYARIDTRAQPFQPTSCTSVVEQVRSDLRKLLNDKEARIDIDPLPTLPADQRQLTQLFQNLIQNALKFHSQEVPVVHISAVRQEGDWLFSVKDNGIGMDMKFAEQIFSIFQRLHTREEYPGTGIGLSICKKIVERHGGKIWVESQPGQGATFFFTLPATQAFDNKTKPAENKHADSSDEGATPAFEARKAGTVAG